MKAANITELKKLLSHKSPKLSNYMPRLERHKILSTSSSDVCVIHNLKFKFEANTRLCEICAVRQAFKGLKMTHIESGIVLDPHESKSLCQVIQLQENKEKKHILMEFTRELEDIQAQISTDQRAYQAMQSQGVISYGFTHLQHTYEMLFQSWKSIPQKMHYPKSSSNIIKTHITELKIIQEDLNNIKLDIQLNLQNIFKVMQISQLKDIIQKYHVKLNVYNNQIQIQQIKLNKLGFVDFRQFNNKCVQLLQQAINNANMHYSFECPPQKQIRNQKQNFEFLHKILKSEPCEIFHQNEVILSPHFLN